MPETSVNQKMEVWPRNWTTYFIETASIALLNLVSLALQQGHLDFDLIFSAELGLRVIGSLCLWFANKFTLEYVLQSRINKNKVTQNLPFELTIASISVTTLSYLVFYPIFIFLNYLTFDLARFLQGLFATCGLSLLIVIVYAGNQIWQSWWSDGEFLFNPRPAVPVGAEDQTRQHILINHAKGTTNYKLRDVLYFISESRIAFMVDTFGKKWTTQYNLAELEEMLTGRFFRLNRKVLVSRQAITEIKKLPNHRLNVTIGSSEVNHQETISRYKSTRFKQWYGNGHRSE